MTFNHSATTRRPSRSGPGSYTTLLDATQDRRRWDTREQLRIAIVTWIERTYHHRRKQTALGRLTPAEYELIMTPKATQAA